MRTSHATTPLLTAGIVLGIGLGGFVDGIVLHQILQWHHMVTEPFPPDSVRNLELNTLGDGLFHAFSWLMTAVGLALLWRASRRPGGVWSGKLLGGGMLIGWGYSISSRGSWITTCSAFTTSGLARIGWSGTWRSWRSAPSLSSAAGR